MRALKSYILWVAISLVAAVGFAACGSGGNRNDQGVAFTFLGWYWDTAGETGASGASVGLSEINPEEPAAPSQGTGGMVLLYAGVENHLTAQALRVERIVHSYYIPGATVQPPQTSVAAPAQLDPARTIGSGGTGGGTGGTGGGIDVNPDSSLPDSFCSGGTCATKAYIGVPIIPPAVREFIALNREQFPEAPFVMVVNSYATGVTSAGSSIESNPVEIEITIAPDNIIPPTGGSDSSGSSASSSSLSGEEG